MGNCIATTSKLMGGDGVAAAEVLTTAMNQYGISLDDPMKASAEMARMMNVMAGGWSGGFRGTSRHQSGVAAVRYGCESRQRQF